MSAIGRNKTIVICLIGLTTIGLLPFTNCSNGFKNAAEDSSSASSVATGINLEAVRSQSLEMLSSKCVSCHADMTADTVLSGNKYVIEGYPETSPLYLQTMDKLCPPDGSGFLDYNQMTTLRDWILAEGGVTNSYLGGTPTNPAPTTPTGPVTFNQVRAILSASCTSCHNGGGQAPRLDGDGPTIKATTYNGQPLVVPNNPNSSLLLTSLSSMPKGSPLGLSSTQANTIRAWINAGAP